MITSGTKSQSGKDPGAHLDRSIGTTNQESKSPDISMEKRMNYRICFVENVLRICWMPHDFGEVDTICWTKK